MMADPDNAESQRLLDSPAQQRHPSIFRSHTLGLAGSKLPSVYDAALSFCVASVLVLSAATFPVATPHYLVLDERVMSWLFYSARVMLFAFVFALTCLPIRWRRKLAVLRVTILLTAWAVYAYRDIWPLATYARTPLDAAEGPILWVKISLLTVAAIVIPLVSPRRPPSSTIEARPDETASILSLVTYSWLDPLIGVAQKMRHLPFEELPPLADYNSMEHLVETSFERVDPMRTSDARDKRNVAWGLTRLFCWDLAIMGSMVVLASASSFLVPLGLKHILSHVENGSKNETIRPWLWIVALLLGSMTVSMSMQFYHYVSTQVVARTQAILTQVMFDHALRMRSKEDTSKSGADKTVASTSAKPAAAKSKMPATTNLVTTDLTNVTNASTFVLLIVLETPIQIVLSIYFLYSILGWSTFIGLAVMLALFPVPTELSKRTRDFQKAKAVKTDQRVTLVIQMLNMIRTVKFLGWEPEQSETLEAARKDELNAVRNVSLLQIWIGAINVCIPLLIMLASYATFTLVMRRELSASIVFSSISLFEILRSQLNLVFFRIPIVTNGKVSLDRINRFLHETELLDQFERANDQHIPLDASGAFMDIPLPHHEISVRDQHEIGIRNGHFTWTSQPEGDRNFVLKIDDEVIFKKGALNIVYGPTACGKTSLLMALLGEMHYMPRSERSLLNLPREGGVAYAAQESWVLATTIRENILFGSRFEEGRYKKVLSACALELDIDILEDGDQTIVGEKGITLSGGQKARITLARAFYSQAKTVLIDDVLSNLDNDTMSHVVTHCFLADFTHDRTVIMVANNVKAVMPFAAWAVELGPDGVVLKSESPLEEGSASLSSNLTEETLIMHAETAVDSAPQLHKPEETEEGLVGWQPMTLLFGNMSPHPVIFWLIFLGALFLASMVLNTQIWLLGYWADQYSKTPAAGVSTTLYLGIYTALLVGSMFTDVLARFLHLQGSLQASDVIHKKLVSAILGTTLRWLEYTPTSRVIARATEDIGAIDGQISGFLFKLLELSTSMLVRLILVMVIAPFFTLGVALVTVVGGLYAKAYMKAQLPVKREQSKTRAPLIGHLNETISSLVSVRAYGAQERFRKDMYVRIDRWTRASNTFYNLNRWVIVRADLVGTIFTVSLATYLIYSTKASASNVGFSLNMAIAFSSKVFEWVRTFNAFEVAGNSLERIQQYLNIEQEQEQQPVTAVGEPDATWPESGDLKVTNLSAQYSLDGPEILKGITFSVEPGERVGIVGRTGCGKSTLVLALLRCIRTNISSSLNPRGEVIYSGRHIDSISLPTLRKNLTIVPQIPELFYGTIRQNLDPFQQYDEEELRTALLSAQGLDSDVKDSVREKLELEMQVSSGGKNLSAGQRQIVSLARAIVRKSKLLIMDEATSSIDDEGNTMIQIALRKLLDRNVTVLTVAHRLSTIIGYDKVLVLNPNGEHVEFGTPRELLLNDKSHFCELVHSAPAEDREFLYAAFKNPS